jgi:hypothetical protein
LLRIRAPGPFEWAAYMKHVSQESFSPEVTADVAPSQRGKARDSMLLVAALQVEGRDGRHQVRVRNLSTGGLMAEFDQPIAIGTKVVIDLRGIGAVDGEIAWATQGRVGIALSREINPAAARKPIAGKATPALDKPIKSIF